MNSSIDQHGAAKLRQQLTTLKTGWQTYNPWIDVFTGWRNIPHAVEVHRTHANRKDPEVHGVFTQRVNSNGHRYGHMPLVAVAEGHGEDTVWFVQPETPQWIRDNLPAEPTELPDQDHLYHVYWHGWVSYLLNYDNTWKRP